VPGVFVVGDAASQGRYFGRLIARQLKGREPKHPFRYLHLISLPQLQNRLRVRTQWLWSYYTGQRSSRLIPEPPLAETVNLAIERTIAP
jgi:NADH:ubiquinone reductase (H+-translocating)